MSKRSILNLAALAVVLGGGVSLSAQKTTNPGTGGACCEAPGSVCYVNLGDGILVAYPNSRYC